MISDVKKMVDVYLRYEVTGTEIKSDQEKLALFRAFLESKGYIKTGMLYHPTWGSTECEVYSRKPFSPVVILLPSKPTQFFVWGGWPDTNLFGRREVHQAITKEDAKGFVDKLSQALGTENVETHYFNDDPKDYLPWLEVLIKVPSCCAD